MKQHMPPSPPRRPKGAHQQQRQSKEARKRALDDWRAFRAQIKPYASGTNQFIAPGSTTAGREATTSW